MKLLIIALIGLSNSLYAFEITPESLGERLFQDIRFSQYFHHKSNGDVNYELKKGAPELDMIVIRGREVPSPFAGEAMSCATCHMVDQSFSMNPGGMRGYNDFAKTTKLPERILGETHTLRNTQSLVGIGSKYIQNKFSHHDGEFHNHAQTVLANFTGTNMGWMKYERKVAFDNIIKVIRNDKGLSEQAQEFGGAYEKLFKEIASPHAIDITQASDNQIVAKVIFYINQYMLSLDFEKDENDIYIGSSYDEFLKLNDLPREPKEGVSLEQYSKELAISISKLKTPKFIPQKYFPNHDMKIGFGSKEFRGLNVFLGKGQCVSCHSGPLFTDQFFHNTGTMQIEYDGLHGKGSFAKSKIPSFEKRKDEDYFMSRASLKDKNKMDLGLWNFFGRKDKKVLTTYVTKKICSSCDMQELLPRMIGRIKTPTLRNLGHSFPYMHNGSASSIKDALIQHRDASQLMQRGELRNGAVELMNMKISDSEILDLEAFLVSLNENYE